MGPFIVIKAVIVRPAVTDSIRHARQNCFGTGSGDSGDESSDPAHDFSVAWGSMSASCALLTRPSAAYAGARSWLRRRDSIKYILMLKWPDVLNLAKNGNPAPDRKVVKTDAEWRAQLSDEQYYVTRQAGTERAFSSEMCSLFEPGIYSCLCCETVLFDASEKFESHTGWPSFTQPIKANVIAYRFDGPAFLQRVETICNTCDAHLGHVFPDGPPPSGLRYCMNAVALKKVAKV